VHRTAGTAGYHCGWALVETSTCPALWGRTAPVAVDPLLRGLLAHLATPDASRVRPEAEIVVLDLLGTALATVTMQLPLPVDDRCRRIVEALLADPLHPWGLADWGTEIGASPRTLSRVLMAETGMTFAQWRGHARLRAAVGLLDEGLPVAVVARRVGYATPSAFVSAFRRLTGRTPGAYAGEGAEQRAALRAAG
jgi:AraC-like DNA-binding protein